MSFTAGDAVTWTGSDDDVPAGMIGKVLGYNDAGKVRVQFHALKSQDTLVFWM
jgi:hypothetical protein